jgi:acyl carrier protein
MINNINMNVIKQALSDADVVIENLESNLDKTFIELGLDSLDVFNVFLELETLTGQKINDEDLDKFVSMNDVFNKYDNLAK